MKDKLFPIEFMGWDLLDTPTPNLGNIIFHDVHFKEAFGPWKKDEYCVAIEVLFTEARMIERLVDGKERVSCNFGIVFKPQVEPEVIAEIEPITEDDPEIEDLEPQSTEVPETEPVNVNIDRRLLDKAIKEAVSEIPDQAPFEGGEALKPVDPETIEEARQIFNSEVEEFLGKSLT